ncbi:MAG TPA: type II toxin-antitoxin system RelE/ParE family toxin [Geobacteraceae bacterium]|nr:type II toxin-antitoxin system RelE/ParE family toxin [Geobacteraceae bacterium]
MPRWLKRAAQELEEVETYIAGENPDSAVAMVLKIIEAVEMLDDFQGMGRPGRVSGTRELVVNGTPFVVPYRVRNGRVEILRVYHTARKWPDRF